MRSGELSGLLEYFVYYPQKIENDIIEMEHRLIFRNFDEVDYLELIILLTRYKEFNAISREVMRILKINPI